MGSIDQLIALIAERAKDFAGREWVFRSISEWCNRASPVYLLTGGPGTGKTAIAARIVQALLGVGVCIEDLRLAPEPSAFLFHFCRAANDTTLDPLRFVERLSTHLAERHPPFLNALASLGDRNVTVNASLGNVEAASGAAVTNVSCRCHTDVHDLIVSRGGSRMITAGGSTIRLWDLDQLLKGNLLTLRENDVGSIEFLPDGSKVYTSSSKSEVVRARDISTGELIHEWPGHEQGVHALAISADGQTLACGCGSGVVRIWDTATGAARPSVEGPKTKVTVLELSHDNRLLATGADDGKVHLVTGTARMQWHSPEGWIRLAVFSDDGRLLLTGSPRQLRVWDVTRGTLRWSFEGETFYDGCFSGDGRHVVLEEGIEVLRSAWDIETRQQVPLDDNHRRAMDRHLRLNERHWAWDRVVLDRESSELTLREVTTHASIAWISLPYAQVVHHLSGEIWGLHRGGQSYLYTLETR